MAATRFVSIAPIFPVRDLPEALAFYRHVLGFELAWSWGEPPELAAVCRDAVEITLSRHPDDRTTGTSRAYLRISGIDAYYDRIECAGAKIVVPIGDRRYGLRDFRVTDPSGNELDVGEVIASVANA